MVTRPLTIPWYLRGEMGNLTPGTEVAYAMFEDGTGIILSRMDGEWDGIVPGDITVKKGALTMQDKVKAKLLRGSATETCYIQSIGGNFA